MCVRGKVNIVCHILKQKHCFQIRYVFGAACVEDGIDVLDDELKVCAAVGWHVLSFGDEVFPLRSER